MRVRGYIAAIAILVIYVSPFIPLAGADSSFPHEYRIKAAFIYNFVSFIDGWKFQRDVSGDNENDANSDKPILLGIIGEDPFQDAFASLKEKRAKGRNIDIRYFKGFSDLNSQDKKNMLHPDIGDIKECDLLFVCSTEQRYISNILDPIRKQTILTISDTQDFLENGGIINFIVEKHKVGFEINTEAARRAKLIIRSKLIRLAKRVVEKDDVEEK